MTAPPPSKSYFGVSPSSLPGYPAVGMFIGEGVYPANTTLGTTAIGISGAAEEGPTLKVALVDENGTFGPAWAEYALVELEESLFSQVGGPEGLALIRTHLRCTTTLYLAIGGILGKGKVLKGKKFTKYLPRHKEGAEAVGGEAGGKKRRGTHKGFFPLKKSK